MARHIPALGSLCVKITLCWHPNFMKSSLLLHLWAQSRCVDDWQVRSCDLHSSGCDPRLTAPVVKRHAASPRVDLPSLMRSPPLKIEMSSGRATTNEVDDLLRIADSIRRV